MTIKAQLTGGTIASACGVFAYKVIDLMPSTAPSTPLEAYRGEALRPRVRSIQLDEVDGPRSRHLSAI